MHFYSHNIGEFASAVQVLTPEEIGIAIILIDEYARTEKPLDDETIREICESLASRTRIATESLANDERIATESLVARYEKRILRKFFAQTDDGWICPMIEEQIKKYVARAEINRKNAQKPRKRKAEIGSDSLSQAEVSESSASGMRVGSESLASGKQIATTKNQEPITNNQERDNYPLTPLQGVAVTATAEGDEKPKRKRAAAVPRPEDVSEEVWEDFKTLRKAKRAPITATAISGLRKEAEKAGLTLEGALRVCIKNGWQGFEASWVSKDDRSEYLPNSRFKRQECRNYDLPI